MIDHVLLILAFLFGICLGLLLAHAAVPAFKTVITDLMSRFTPRGLLTTMDDKNLHLYDGSESDTDSLPSNGRDETTSSESSLSESASSYDSDDSMSGGSRPLVRRIEEDFRKDEEAATRKDEEAATRKDEEAATRKDEEAATRKDDEAARKDEKMP